MKLAHYVKKEHLFIADSIPDTPTFYHMFSHFLKDQGIIQDWKTVKRLFLKRESVQSTGIGKGAATPHIFSKEFSQFYIFAALVRGGVDFKFMDGIPVRLIFLIVSDDRDVGLHLKSLAHIARLVDTQEIVPKAETATNADELYSILLECENSLSHR